MDDLTYIAIDGKLVTIPRDYHDRFMSFLSEKSHVPYIDICEPAKENMFIWQGVSLGPYSIPLSKRKYEGFLKGLKDSDWDIAEAVLKLTQLCLEHNDDSYNMGVDYIINELNGKGTDDVWFCDLTNIDVLHLNKKKLRQYLSEWTNCEMKPYMVDEAGTVDDLFLICVKLAYAPSKSVKEDLAGNKVRPTY